MSVRNWKAGKSRSFYERFGMFAIPAFILVTFGIGLILEFAYKNVFAANIVYIIGIIPGGIQLIAESFVTLKNKSFALDYIAMLAIIVAVISKQFLVGGVIALMISGGNALETYAQKRARRSLTNLSKRIPDEALIWKSDTDMKKEKVEEVKVGDNIFIRKGEVIPLDGKLVTERGEFDESSLTGEAEFISKMRGDKVMSGTVNMGGSIVVQVTKEKMESTYMHIVKMVEEAQEEKSPVIRLAHKYNAGFTILALIIAAGAWLYWGDLEHVLAVLVIATPCPLLIAAPVALIGGMNAAAKKKIIVKNLAALEDVSMADTLVFDKTGTITMGKPLLKEIIVKDKRYDKKKILSVAEAIERNSLHPFAHSIMAQARKEKVPRMAAEKVEEILGKGIAGIINGKKYSIVKGHDSEENHLHFMEGRKLVAEIIFEDVLKANAREIIDNLERKGMEIHVFTGDKKETADKLKKILDGDVTIQAGMSPEDKQKGIRELKKQGKNIAMVGDGINDAPALALANVGMVFSHEENTASSEAADIVFLGGHFSEVYDSINISQKTMKIAKQSMITGIGLSVIGMFFAAFGFIIPLIGAILQEAIDVATIVNSLRTLGIRR